jgi:hypothetical protein
MRILAFVAAIFSFAASIIAGTVQQHFLRDPSFKLYSVTFRITQAPGGSVIDVHVGKVYDIRYMHDHPGVDKPAPISVPKRYIEAAIKNIRETRYELRKHSGKPQDSYVALLYAPALGDRVIVDVKEPE